MVSSMSLANIVPVMRAVLFPLFRLSTRDLLIRLIGCQPIKAQRFRNPPKKEKGHPQRSSLHHTCSHIIAIFISFSFFLLAVLVSLVSYAVPCCIGRAYLPTLICFCLHDNLPGFLYGVLSCNKYQSWVEAPP
jgi:hypothetical protein